MLNCASVSYLINSSARLQQGARRAIDGNVERKTRQMEAKAEGKIIPPGLWNHLSEELSVMPSKVSISELNVQLDQK